MPYKNEISARLVDPKNFDKFCRQNNAGGQGVDFIFGIKSGKSEIQSIRFDAEKFTNKQAKEWLKRNKKTPLEFEPAKDTTKDRSYAEYENSFDFDNTGKPNFEPVDKEEKQENNSEDNEDEDDEDDEDEKDDLGLSDDETYMWVEAFRSGSHTDMEGEVDQWSDEDIQEMADRYNRDVKSEPAPVVLGHPEDTAAPAYGWIEEAKNDGGTLLLKLSSLNKDFVDALKEGAYKTRSLSVYEEDNKIRHLGFLGGQQPAIKGLKPLSFSDKGRKYKTYNYKEDTMADKVKDIKTELAWYKKLFNNFKLDIKNYSEERATIDREDGESPDQETPEEDMTESAGDEHREQVDKETTGEDKVEKNVTVPAETVKKDKDEETEVMNENEELKNMVEELTKKVKDLEELIEKKPVEIEEGLANREFADVKKENKLFCEKLIREGNLRPADFEQELLNLNEKAALDTSRQFGETSTLYTKSYCESYKDHLKSRPKMIEFGEIVIKDIVPQNTLVTVPQVEEFVQKFVEDKMKENPNISYEEAMRKAFDEVPENMVSEYKKTFCHM